MKQTIFLVGAKQVFHFISTKHKATFFMKLETIQKQFYQKIFQPTHPKKSNGSSLKYVYSPGCTLANIPSSHYGVLLK